MNTTNRSFMLYTDMGALVKALPESARARWASAVFDYVSGEPVDKISDNPLENAVWEQTKAKLQFGLDKAAKRTQDARNAANTRYGKTTKEDSSESEGMQGNASACDSMQGHASAPTVQNNNSTSTDTVTKTKQISVLDTDKDITRADADSVEPGGGADGCNAEGAAQPAPAADLFTLDQIRRCITKNHVNLSEVGASVFFDQMRDDHWTLYGKPIDRKALTRVLREWAKRHPEYALPDQEDESRDQKPKPAADKPKPIPELTPEQKAIIRENYLRKLKSSVDDERLKKQIRDGFGNCPVSATIVPALYKKLTAEDAELKEHEITGFCVARGYEEQGIPLKNYDHDLQEAIADELWGKIVEDINAIR